MRRRWTILAGLSAVLLLGGCTAVGGGALSGGATDSGGSSVPEQADGVPAPDEVVPDSDEARSIISQGSLYVTVADPIASAREAVDIVEAAEGRIDRRSERPATDASGSASAELTVRIPSDRLTPTVERLKELGELEDYELTEDDVSAQTRDLDARIAALRASTGRLSALLATAATTSDLIEIETSLSQRQGELESLEAQSRALADQVELATLSVSFGAKSTAPIDPPADFLSGVATGWEALVAFVAAVLVGVGVLVPWLIVPAIAGIVVLAIIASRRRRAGARPVAATMEE